jgi:hypothetical protein
MSSGTYHGDERKIKSHNSQLSFGGRAGRILSSDVKFSLRRTTAIGEGLGQRSLIVPTGVPEESPQVSSSIEPSLPITSLHFKSHAPDLLAMSWPRVLSNRQSYGFAERQSETWINKRLVPSSPDIQS